MKKLLSFLAAGALALGLIGCSGDLHDYEANEECIGLYLAGDVQKDKDNRGKLTFVDANTQTYKFTYDSTKHNYWGGAKGTINFKLVTDATTWTQDFGWKKDTPVFLSLNDDFLTLQARDAANSNPGNIKVENLINGKEYVITVNYDAPNKVAKVKIEGPSIDFPTLKLVDSDGNEYPLTREGPTYSYVWTPAKAGSMSFYVTNGYLYYDADGNVNTKKPDTEDYIKVSYEANKEYIVRIETAYDKDAKVKIETGINDKSILGRADVIGGWDGFDAGHKLEKVSDDTYQIDFTASASTFEFAVREKAGSWDTRWFGGIPEGKGKPATPTLMDDVEVGGAAKSAVYYDKDPGLDGKNIVIKGLSKDSIYTIVIQIKDASKKEIAVSCKLKQAVEGPTEYSWKGLTFKGGWEGWWKDTATLTDAAVQEYTFTAATETDEHPATGNEFGIFGVGKNLWEVKDLVLGTRTEMTFKDANGTNSTMAENWVAGATYKFKLELTDNSVDAPKAYITVTKE